MDKTIQKAKAYSNTKHCLSIAETLLYMAFFSVVQVSGLSSYIAQAASSITGSRYPGLILYMAAISLMLTAITFPIDYLGSFVIEHRFNLSRQRFSSWLGDYLKKITIGGLLYLIMIIVLYYLLKSSEARWWLYAGFFYFFFSVIIARVFPLIIIPLFYKLDKISQGSLKERLFALTKRAGVKVLDIYSIGLGEKTRKANAALCGWGATKRILISDTLLQEYAEDEIEATLAHELAHYKYRHFWKLIFVNFITTLIGFAIINTILQALARVGYIGHIYDIAAFPVLATLFLIYTTIVTPLYNLISRRYEAQADAEAIAITRRPAAFSVLIKKLTAQNLSDPQPNPIVKFFFYDHPPAQERIDYCDAIAQGSRGANA